jgi:hypothetical protein
MSSVRMTMMFGRLSTRGSAARTGPERTNMRRNTTKLRLNAGFAPQSKCRCLENAPTGLRPPAQGCAAGATLGKENPSLHNPNEPGNLLRFRCFPFRYVLGFINAAVMPS